MLFLDCLVDMNSCISLTGNKLLCPLRHEAISPASTGFHQRRKENKIYVFALASCRVLPVGPFQPANAEEDQNTENRVTSWPQAQTTETAAAIKTEVVGHTIEKQYELVMTQIILFAGDDDNPFRQTQQNL